MIVKSEQSVTIPFTTANPTTGAAQNADSLPTAQLFVNGTANAATVTVTNISTGEYKASVTLPSLAAGDIVAIDVTATVASVTGKARIFEAVADTARISEVPASVWSQGTRTLTSFGTLASDVASSVWSAGTRTLTGFGTLVSDIWNAATRSLTDKSGFAPTVSEIVSAILLNPSHRLATDSSGYVTVGSNQDKTGYELTSAERDAVAARVEYHLLDESDQQAILQAIVDKIAEANPSLDELTLGGIASAVRNELATELARIDVAISSRLAAGDYIAPDNTTVQTLADRLTAARAANLDNIDVAVSSRLAGSGYVAPANNDIAAIKAKTDQLQFTGGLVDANATVDTEVITAALLSGGLAREMSVQEVKDIVAQFAPSADGVLVTPATLDVNGEAIGHGTGGAMLLIYSVNPDDGSLTYFTKTTVEPDGEFSFYLPEGGRWRIEHVASGVPRSYVTIET